MDAVLEVSVCECCTPGPCTPWIIRNEVSTLGVQLGPHGARCFFSGSGATTAARQGRAAATPASAAWYARAAPSSGSLCVTRASYGASPSARMDGAADEEDEPLSSVASARPRRSAAAGRPPRLVPPAAHGEPAAAAKRCLRGAPCGARRAAAPRRVARTRRCGVGAGRHRVAARAAPAATASGGAQRRARAAVAAATPQREDGSTCGARRRDRARTSPTRAPSRTARRAATGDREARRRLEGAAAAGRRVACVGRVDGGGVDAHDERAPPRRARAPARGRARAPPPTKTPPSATMKLLLHRVASSPPPSPSSSSAAAATGAARAACSSARPPSACRHSTAAVPTPHGSSRGGVEPGRRSAAGLCRRRAGRPRRPEDEQHLSVLTEGPLAC